jgi:hypothetical protein
MKTPFLVYIKAVGIYALLTLPALFLPVMYLISIVYVLFYGWFAWFLFTLIYVITVFCNPGYRTKMVILFMGVLAALAFAFQMLQVFGAENNVWHSGGFLLFPLTAVLSGWISLSTYRNRVMVSDRYLLLNISENSYGNEKIS